MNNQKDIADGAVAAIVADPEPSEAKKWDLASVYVYKFQCINQQYLLAYEYAPATSVLLLGTARKLLSQPQAVGHLRASGCPQQKSSSLWHRHKPIADSMRPEYDGFLFIRG